MTRRIVSAAIIFAATCFIGLWPGAASAESQLKMNHAIHAENDLDCETCHMGVEASTAAADRFRPDHDVCADCHDVDDDNECAYCHVNPEDPTAAGDKIPGAGRFQHMVHSQSGMDCAACHGDPARSEPVIPAKAECRGCHETASYMEDCMVCHLPSEELVPRSHVASYRITHGSDARIDDVGCINCHTRTECQECHSGDNVRPRAHPLNYAFEHALEARSQEVDCASCHFDTQFCADCHRTERVLPLNHSRADWAQLTGTGGRHADEARFNLDSCVGCHDAGGGDPICADCHGR